MTNSSFFQKTNNVLPSFTPYYQWAGWGDKQGAASVNNIFLDLNADGFNDIIYSGYDQTRNGLFIDVIKVLLFAYILGIRSKIACVLFVPVPLLIILISLR